MQAVKRAARLVLGLAVIAVPVVVTAGPATAAVPTNNYFPIAGYTRASAGCSNNFSVGGHEGTDCFAPHGTRLIAVEAGRIDYVRPQASPWTCPSGPGDKSGNRISLTGNSGSRYYYGHLSAFASGLVAGASVVKGQVVGYLGNTGNARCSTPHLHFQIWDAGVLVAPYPRMGTWTAAGGGGTPDAYQPVGFLDSVTARGGGAIGLYGWAVDPDTPTRAIAVHIYVTKSNGVRVGPWGLTANRSRPDVGAAYPAYGPNHGYETVLSGFPVGSTKVDAYAIDSSGAPNDHRLLGTKWVTVR
jgi:murein DD-endopeptidase MepM/ murein hydrolase activator NlpD